MATLTNGNHRKRVTAVTEKHRTYSGKNGEIFIHKVTFDDGSEGEHHSSKPNSEFFKVGIEADFECEVKVNGQYTNYKIKPIKDNNNGFKGGFSGKGGYNDSGKWLAATESFKASIELLKLQHITLTQIAEQTKRNFQIISECVQQGNNQNNPQG